MRIAILTLGTRGDVQPYLALALGLQRAGHLVTLATSRDFETEISGRGIRFGRFEFSIREILDDPESRAAFVSKRAAIRLYRKVAPQMPRLLDDAWAAAQGSELILFHPKILNALDIAEKLKVPAMLAFYLPAFNPTKAFPAPFLPIPARWGGIFNKVSHTLFLRLMTAPYTGLVNRWRAKALGLPPRSRWSEATQRFGRGIPKLYGYSRHLVPRPLDWDDSAHITGQWFLDGPADWHPPEDLERFLAAGTPPVLISFGSIIGSEPERTTRIVVEALGAAGQRGLLVGGWGGLHPTASTDAVRFVESVPFDWVLPRVGAVVHHGGAGSTGEGLRAGKATIVCPFFGDQPFWGRRVYKLGVGPEPIPQKRLSAQNLASAIRTAVLDEGIQRRARDVGQKIRTEDGVSRAIEMIEQLAQKSAGRDRPPLP